MNLHFVEIVSAFIVLFAVIDILGSVPIILDIKKKGTKFSPFKATSISFLILILFLFIGEALLGLFNVDISSFAIAGSFVLMIMAFEMILGIEIFKHGDSPNGATIVPIAFPLIAGAGSFTTLLSLRAEYQMINILIALLLNILFVYFVLKSTHIIERIIGNGGIYVLKKFFGIILMAMSVKLFITNLGNLAVQFMERLNP
ncbi:MAG: MarC family protein [Breznakibacter sp.]|nr:MarC family protein [Breznakibacter sp.]